MFFATFTSTVALGWALATFFFAVLLLSTLPFNIQMQLITSICKRVKISSDLDNRIGVSEYLLMNSIAGKLLVAGNSICIRKDSIYVTYTQAWPMLCLDANHFWFCVLLAPSP